MYSCRLTIERSFVIRKWKYQAWAISKFLLHRGVCVWAFVRKILTKILILLSYSCLAFYPRPMCTNDCYCSFYILFFCTLGLFKIKIFYIAVKVNKFICTQHVIASIFFVCFPPEYSNIWRVIALQHQTYVHLVWRMENWDNGKWNVRFTQKMMCIINSQSINIKYYTDCTQVYTLRLTVHNVPVYTIRGFVSLIYQLVNPK